MSVVIQLFEGGYSILEKGSEIYGPLNHDPRMLYRRVLGDHPPENL